MTDRIVVDCGQRTQALVALTAAERADRDAVAAADAATMTAAVDRRGRRDQAIAQLRAIANAGTAPTAAQQRFMAKVLAVLLANVDLDPDA